MAFSLGGDSVRGKRRGPKRDGLLVLGGNLGVGNGVRGDKVRGTRRGYRHGYKGGKRGMTRGKEEGGSSG